MYISLYIVKATNGNGTMNTAVTQPRNLHCWAALLQKVETCPWSMIDLSARGSCGSGEFQDWATQWTLNNSDNNGPSSDETMLFDGQNRIHSPRVPTLLPRIYSRHAFRSITKSPRLVSINTAMGFLGLHWRPSNLALCQDPYVSLGGYFQVLLDMLDPS